MPRISPPATSPSPAQKKPSAAHGLTHPRAPLAFACPEETLRRARPHAPPRASARPSVPFRAAPQKGRSRRDFHPSVPCFSSSITASNASAVAVVEEAVAAVAFPSDAVVEEAVAAVAFPSDAEAAEAEAASSNGGDGDDDGCVQSRRHPCVHRRARLRRMRLRRRPR